MPTMRPDGEPDDDAVSEPVAGAALVRTDQVATAAFAVVQVAAVVVPKGPLLAASVLVSLCGFAAGCVAFLVGFGAAVGRSRDEPVDVPGLVFLRGSAPEAVRRSLFGLLAAQVVVALVAAGVRPFTPVAFGVLFPMLGMGVVAAWAGRHGSFDGSLRPSRTSGAEAGAEEPDDVDDFDQLFRRRRGRSR